MQPDTMGGRVYGPYVHRRRWRVVTINLAGIRTAQVCDTLEEANDLIRRLEARLQVEPLLRISTALERYRRYHEHKGNKLTSVATAMFRLHAFFGDEIWRPVRRLDGETCRELYDRRVARTAVDTHRNELAGAKTFLDWCVQHRYVTRNPVTAVRPIGRRRHGKPQFRINEARAWMDVATKLADGGEAGAVAAMMALFMGMRASEIVRCVGRDVDDRDRLLWIPVSKTQSGKRTLEIPAVLRHQLVRVAEPVHPYVRLFPHTRAWYATG